MSICSRALYASIVMLAVATSSHACLWIHGTTLEGHYIRVEGSDYAAWLKGRVAEKPTDAQSLLKPFEYHSDDALARMNDSAVQALLKGDPAKAVTMLQEIEAAHPGQYYTAANLGTAYELAGNDTKALEWIKEGIHRNPDSHMRTEWLHARILEAKLQLKDDPEWLKSHTITGADFTQLKNPQYALHTLQRIVSAEDLRHSLRTQLSVRMLFVKPKDVIVAQLLRELSLVEAQVGLLQQAAGFAELAELYGLDPGLMVAERVGWSETIRKTPQILERELRRKAFSSRALLVVGITCLVILLLVLRKRSARSVARTATP
jgi:hypothetical protein